MINRFIIWIIKCQKIVRNAFPKTQINSLKPKESNNVNATHPEMCNSVQHCKK